VKALFERLGIPARAVSEYQVARDLGSAKAIVLPAARGVASSAWGAVMEAVGRGAHLIADGWFEQDDAGLPAERIGASRRTLTAVEETRPGTDTTPVTVGFASTLPESWFAAVGTKPTMTRRGMGAIHHHPLPLEWGDNGDAVEAYYASALASAGVMPVAKVEGPVPEGCTVRVLPFREATVIVAINEAAADRTVRVRQGNRTVDVWAPAGTSNLLVVNRRTGAVSALRNAGAR
jgi:hypothetical protein